MIELKRRAGAFGAQADAAAVVRVFVQAKGGRRAGRLQAGAVFIETDAERIERDAQPAPEILEIAFLRGPEAKQRVFLRFFGQRLQKSRFVRMKAARGDRHGNARQLDIDAEWRGIERADAEISRVAEGKIDGVRDKARLSPFVFGEDLIRNGDTG